MNETVLNISNALKYGAKSKSKEWTEFLQEKIKTLVDEYDKIVSNDVYNERIRKLEQLLRNSPDIVKPHIHYLICKCYYQSSIKYLDMDYKVSVNLIKECYFHYEECGRLLKIQKRVGCTYIKIMLLKYFSEMIFKCLYFL